MIFASKGIVDRLREQYPKGTRVELVSMDDPYSKLRPGDQGRVSSVDDTGTIHVAWDRGFRLGIVYGVDQVRRIEDEIKYETGADFFRDTAVSHGMEEALGICGRYLSVQLKTQSQEEKQFCRELFEAIIEAAAGPRDSGKTVYPYPFEKAQERREVLFYNISCERNAKCAQAIDTAISQSCYERDFYNFEIAAMVAVHGYGFERVKTVLEYNIHIRESDGWFSRANKEWASSFDLPGKAFGGAILNAHPVLIDGFAGHFRKLYQELNREIPNPLAAAEMSTEQNYNMIDGLRNNLPAPRPDLTDGQTHEELQELAPHTLSEERSSVMDQIKEARKKPEQSPPKKELGRGGFERER